MLNGFKKRLVKKKTAASGEDRNRRIFAPTEFWEDRLSALEGGGTTWEEVSDAAQVTGIPREEERAA